MTLAAVQEVEKPQAPAPLHVLTMTYSRGATINCGNFNNQRVDFTATVQVPAGSNPDAIYDRLRTYVEAKVQAEVRSYNGGR